MNNDKLVTTLVSKWNDVDRPFKAELRVGGHAVEKSYHASMQEAFIWAEAAKERKVEELRR